MRFGEEFLMTSKMMKKLLIGTGNAGKISEMRRLLGGFDIELIDLSGFKNITPPEESGRSFEENAEIKARAYSLATGYATIADDSGLSVKSLGGRPGIYSARFARNGASDEENILKLLDEMNEGGRSDRSARFVCAICLAGPDGAKVFSATADCVGSIAVKPSGFNGFGYDPIFVPSGYSQTFGELPNDIKQRISHRSKAALKLAEFLAVNLDLLT